MADNPVQTVIMDGEVDSQQFSGLITTNTEAFNDPNQHKYTATSGGKYLSSRILTHAGTTIAFALGQKKSDNSLYFDYSILNAPSENESDEAKPSESVEKLDSQCWFEHAKSLLFPQELRVVGEAAVPTYEIPAIDKRGRRVSAASRDQYDKLDLWQSTTLSLMNKDVYNFQVFSDGKYVYLFRQSCESSDIAPLNSNLLCDRFTLVGTSLQRTLEARYRRSRQKRLPFNDQDSLAVRDINDTFFYEPTLCLSFISNLTKGWFTVLQTPSTTGNRARWTFFASSISAMTQIEYCSTDIASDGLFDILGQLYYTCDSSDHPVVFYDTPGACSATTKNGIVCSRPKVEKISATSKMSSGLVMRTIKLGPSHILRGGFGASVYYEQVYTSTDKNENRTATSSGTNEEAKSYKRAARVLLCISIGEASKSDIWLAAIDFGVISDGTLSALPSPLILTKLQLRDEEGTNSKSAATALLSIDPQGVETFGGILDVQVARSSSDPPVVYDSATGALTIFFRNYLQSFSAVSYDSSRSLSSTSTVPLPKHSMLLANGRLRQAKGISIKTEVCSWISQNIAVQVTLSVQLPSGDSITEVWGGKSGNSILCS